MAIGPYPDFSWSHSRDASLQWCERQYYFQYYGKWNGWSAQADPRIQTMYLLTQRTSLQAWAGTIVHEAISLFLHHRPQTETWIEEVRQKMRYQFVDSRKKIFLQSRKAKSFGLEEHYYDAPLSNERVKGVWDKVEACLKSFIQSQLPTEIQDAQKAGRFVYIEPPVSIFHEMQIFQHDFGDFPIYAQPDAVYEDAEGVLHLLDWKTGTPPTHRGPKDIPPQLAFYLLWLKDKGGPVASWEPKNINLSEVYLPTLETYGGAPSNQTWPTAHKRAKTSISRMRAMLQDADQNIASEHSFELTPDTAKCAYCVFRAVCPSDAAIRSHPQGQR